MVLKFDFISLRTVIAFDLRSTYPNLLGAL